jgi:hypothetical protein
MDRLAGLVARFVASIRLLIWVLVTDISSCLGAVPDERPKDVCGMKQASGWLGHGENKCIASCVLSCTLLASSYLPTLPWCFDVRGFGCCRGVVPFG